MSLALSAVSMMQASRSSIWRKTAYRAMSLAVIVRQALVQDTAATRAAAPSQADC